jgi:hypothetical protein
MPECAQLNYDVKLSISKFFANVSNPAKANENIFPDLFSHNIVRRLDCSFTQTADAKLQAAQLFMKLLTK